MDARNILNYIGILRAFQEETTSVSDAVESCAESRSTVYRFLSDAEGWKLIIQSGDDYTVTAAGDLILQEYDCLEKETREEISSLTNLEYGPILLQILANSPARGKAEMVRRSGASRSTVQRTIDKFDDSKWINKQDRRYELDERGEQVVEAYESFEEKIEIVEEKIEFLERLEGVEEKIPLEALAGSRQVVSTVIDTQEVTREINKLEVGNAEPLRALSQAFSAELSDEYEAKIPLEMEAELIVDRSVYTAITHPKRWKYLFRAFRRPNFRILVLPEDVTVGIALYGDERAVITAYNEDHPLPAALIGENEALIEWVERIYERFRSRASPPSRDLFGWAIGD